LNNVHTECLSQRSIILEVLKDLKDGMEKEASKLTTRKSIDIDDINSQLVIVDFNDAPQFALKGVNNRLSDYQNIVALAKENFWMVLKKFSPIDIKVKSFGSKRQKGGNDWPQYHSA